MILRDRDRTVDLCCDNVVGLVFGDLWPAIIFILCFVYFDHNGGSASTRCPRWPRSSTRTTSLHGFTKCGCINKFFLTEGNKKILIHKEKSRFPFSATAHRDFEIFVKSCVRLFFNPETLFTVKVENLHAVSHFKHPTCRQLHYGNLGLQPWNQQREWRSGPLFTSHTQHRIFLYPRHKFTFKIFQGWRNKTCLSWVQLTKIWWETGQTHTVTVLDNAPSDKKPPCIRLVLFLSTCIRLLSPGEIG